MFEELSETKIDILSVIITLIKYVAKHKSNICFFGKSKNLNRYK